METKTYLIGGESHSYSVNTNLYSNLFFYHFSGFLEGWQIGWSVYNEGFFGVPEKTNIRLLGSSGTTYVYRRTKEAWE